MGLGRSLCHAAPLRGEKERLHFHFAPSDRGFYCPYLPSKRLHTQWQLQTDGFTINSVSSFDVSVCERVNQLFMLCSDIFEGMRVIHGF